MSPQPSAFDELAADYDRQFSETELGGRLRARVWRRIEAALSPDSRILDLGCGTGRDAVFAASCGAEVVAVDASKEMVAAARRAGASQRDRVRIYHCAMENLRSQPACDGPFDAVISNFGALNCVADPTAVIADLGARMRPGGRLFACVMGPCVPWEWGWMLAHGKPLEAFRRLNPAGVRWRGMRIHYPRVGRFRRLCEPTLRVDRISALGVFLPPTYVEPWIRSRPRLLRRLDALDRRCETSAWAARLADHYLVEAERI